MKWFRFYSEVLHDSKVQTLSADMFRAWINVLCLANEGDERGHLPDMKQIAFALRIKEEKAAQVIGHLQGCGLIDRDENGSFHPHNWDQRQRNSDDVASRVREHRRRKASVTTNRDVTLLETPEKHDVTVRLEERREEKTPLPPISGGAMVATLAPLSREIEDAIEAARVKHGDRVAAFVRSEAATIDRECAGRFDLFLEALSAASLRRPKLEDRNVLSWCITRCKAKINTPPKAGVDGYGKPIPPDRGAAVPGEAESKDCPHCSGIGQVPVFHPTPDPANRIPESISADCVCPRGRMMRNSRDAVMAKRVPDLAEVLAGRSLWLPDPVFMEAGR